MYGIPAENNDGGGEGDGGTIISRVFFPVEYAAYSKENLWSKIRVPEGCGKMISMVNEKDGG